MIAIFNGCQAKFKDIQFYFGTILNRSELNRLINYFHLIKHYGFFSLCFLKRKNVLSRDILCS